MLHACTVKFDMTVNLEKFFIVGRIKQGLCPRVSRYKSQIEKGSSVEKIM